MPECILSIAVPTFNMERWLEKNLTTYIDQRLSGRMEVLCLNNASEDRSKEIIEGFVARMPDIFRLIDRDSRGYGSSINEALSQARGIYFRIVDADDWVDTEALVALVDRLETCKVDVVLTDYQKVNLQTGEQYPVCASTQQVPYGMELTDFFFPKKTLPSIHNTAYRTALLRENGFYMQDKMFFVDEEYVIMPYLWAKNVVYYPFDLYRYQVADPNQSTSPENRAKYQKHRERVLKRLIDTYLKAQEQGASEDSLDYCYLRIGRGVGDHFTTLYLYVKNRAEGRRMAQEWNRYLQTTPFQDVAAKKSRILRWLNRLGISLSTYLRLKKVVPFLCSQ